MEFEWSLGVIIPVVRQDVEESTDKVQTFTGDVRNLEDRADTLRDELASGLDGFLPAFNENRDLAGARRFEDARELGDSLLQNLGRANVNLGDDYHDWDIECKRDAEMLSMMDVSFTLVAYFISIVVLTCSCQLSRCLQLP